MSNQILSKNQYNTLLKDLSKIIADNKKSVEEFAASRLALTYWQVGKRIEEEKLTSNANYYNNILTDLSQDLGLEKTTLNRATKFFKTYKKQPEISNLTWSHYKSLITIKDETLRKKVEEKTKKQGWNVAKMNDEVGNLQGSFEKGTKKVKRPSRPDYLYKAKIVDVVDGDTLILNIDLGFKVIKEQRVRLAQINAPEIKTTEGKKSYRYLRDLCARLDTVVVKTNKVDIYGRYLVDLFYLNEGAKGKSQSYFFEKGVYLSEELVREGVVGVY